MSYVHIFYRLIHCTCVYPLERFPPFFGYYFFNVMLLVLQMLHIYWAVLISRMLYKFIFSKVLYSGNHVGLYIHSAYMGCTVLSHSIFYCFYLFFFGSPSFSKLSSVTHLHPAAGRRWQKWWRGGWQWLAEGEKPQAQSHEWLWGQRPGQWPLTEREGEREMDN